MLLSLNAAWVTASVFTGLVILLHLFFSKYFPKILFHGLWTLAALLYLFPIRVPSPTSIYAVLYHTYFGGEFTRLMMPDISPVHRAATDILLPTIAKSPAPISPLFSLMALGSVLLLLFFLAHWLVWQGQLRRLGKVEIPSLNISLARLMPRLSVSLYRSAHVSTPCVCGLLHPKVIFPCSWNFDEEARTQMALRHELMHVVHWDNLRRGLFTIVLCLQWYNPVVWCLYYMAQADMEFFADEQVILHWPEDIRAAYANLLVNESSQSFQWSPASYLSKQQIKARIVSVMRTKHSSRKTRLFACVCLSVSVLLFATGFTPALPEVMPQDFGLGILIPGTPEEAMRILAQMDECTTENIYNTQLPLRLSNGRFFVFDAEGTGQSGTVSVTFSTIPVEGFPNGHTVTYGYRTGGVDVELGTTKLFNGCSIDFPMDGIDPDELYICNYSSDSIYLKSISAEVN